MPRTFHSSTRAIKPLFADAAPASAVKTKNHWLAAAESSTKSTSVEKNPKPASKTTHHQSKKAATAHPKDHSTIPQLPVSKEEASLPAESPKPATAPANVADQTSRLLQHAPTIAHPPTDPNPQFNLHSTKGEVQWVKLPNQALHRLPDTPTQLDQESHDQKASADHLEIRHSFTEPASKSQPSAEASLASAADNHSTIAPPKVRQHTIYPDDPKPQTDAEKADAAPTSTPEPTKAITASSTEPAKEKAHTVIQPIKSTAKKGLLKWLIITVAVCAVMLGGVAGWKYLSATFPGPTDIYPSSVVNLSGKITALNGQVERQTTGDWETLGIGQTIKAGDVIRTGDNARTAITLDDGSVVRLDQNSSVAFNILTNQAIKLEQRTGQSYHLVHTGSNYQISILDATITAHGTSFITRLLSDQSHSEVTVTNSQVSITAAHLAQSVNVQANQIAQIDHLNHQISVTAMTNQDTSDSFLQWNQQLDQNPQASFATTPTPTPTAKPTPTPTPELTPTPVPTVDTTVSALFLTAVAQSGAVRLNWKITGSAPTGFKLAMSTNPDPTFPPRVSDTVVDISSPDARSYTWSNLDSSPHHFRLGVYNGHGGIRWYSNDVTATALVP